MEYLCRSFVGFDNVAFGEDRSSVREKLGDYKIFKKSESSANTTDEFDDLHAYYTPGDELEAVEFFDGILFLKDKALSIGVASDTFKNWLSEIGTDVIEEKDTLRSRELGLSAHCEAGKITSILFHRLGYYD